VLGGKEIMEVKKLMTRIQMLTEMMNEEMDSMQMKTEAVREWQIKHIGSSEYFYPPEGPTSANLKRIMLMLRIETIKLNNIL